MVLVLLGGLSMSYRFLTLTSASQAAPTATSESVLPTATRPPAKKATPTTRPTVQPTKEPVVVLPRSTQTSLPQPTPQLAEKGPWLLISTSSGLWAANPDDSGLKQLTQQAIVVPRELNSGVSPSNNQFAFILSNGQDQLHGLTLHLLALPGGEDKAITALTSKSTEPGPSESVGNSNFEPGRAMAEFDSLARSPDGSMLAFIGAQQDTSADVYTYIPQSGLINHLTSGPNQAYAPSWSPDGKYIVHYGASTFGTGAGFSSRAPGQYAPATGRYIPSIRRKVLARTCLGGSAQLHSSYIPGANPAAGSCCTR
jgi:hypothetical protein